MYSTVSLVMNLEKQITAMLNVFKVLFNSQKNLKVDRLSAFYKQGNHPCPF